MSPPPQENDEEEDFPPIQPRRYSRSKSLRRPVDSVASTSSNQNLLKRGAIPSHLSSSPNSQSFVLPVPSSVKPDPPPPLSAKPKPPPKSQPNVPFGLQSNPELQKRVHQRRQEMYGQVDHAQETDVDNAGPLEGYEEVQFTTEPKKVCIVSE